MAGFPQTVQHQVHEGLLKPVGRTGSTPKTNTRNYQFKIALERQKRKEGVQKE